MWSGKKDVPKAEVNDEDDEPSVSYYRTIADVAKKKPVPSIGFFGSLSYFLGCFFRQSDPGDIIEDTSFAENFDEFKEWEDNSPRTSHKK